MPQTLASFDPSATMSGHFTNPMPGGIGTIVIYNDSGITIDAMWNSESQVLPAGMIDAIKICDPAQIISWQQDYILSNVSSWPASIVKAVGYRTDEKLPYAAFPVPLQRTSNVGNSVPITTSATSVVNDNNPIPTNVVEATPQGAGSSQLLLKNDGSGKLSGGLISLDALGHITGGVIGTSTTDEIGYGVGGSTGVGIVSATQSLWLFGVGGENDIGYNLYFDGTNFRYLTTGVANRLKFDGSNILEFFNYPSGTAGTIASTGVTQGNVVQGKTAGGGATNAMWTGSTDPGGSASEGDLWFNV